MVSLCGLIYREAAAARIQGLFRGSRDRRRTHAIRSEERILGALKVLMSELGNPEFLGKGGTILSGIGAAPQALAAKALQSTRGRGVHPGVLFRDIIEQERLENPQDSLKSDESRAALDGKFIQTKSLRQTARPLKSEIQKSVHFESPHLSDMASSSSISVPMSQLSTEPRVLLHGTKQFGPYGYPTSSESPYSEGIFSATQASAVETPMKGGVGETQEGYISPPSSFEEDFGFVTNSPVVAFYTAPHGVSSSGSDRSQTQISISSSAPSRDAPVTIGAATTVAAAVVSPLQIPRLSRYAVKAMKRAAEVVFAGGTPSVETLIDEGMALPPEKFDKVNAICIVFVVTLNRRCSLQSLGYQILQDVVLICGVNPLLGWLESHSSSVLGPMQIPCIAVDLACSLVSQLALETGVLPGPDALSADTKPGLSIIHLCCLFRLAASGYSSGGDEVLLPLPDLGGILEDEWLGAATKPPAVGARILRLISGSRGALLAIQVYQKRVAKLRLFALFHHIYRAL